MFDCSLIVDRMHAVQYKCRDSNNNGLAIVLQGLPDFTESNRKEDAEIGGQWNIHRNRIGCDSEGRAQKAEYDSRE